MRAFVWPLAILLTLVVFAGCIDSGNDEGGSEEDTPEPAPSVTPPEPDFDFSTVVDPDHGGHSVAALHTAGHGLTLKGFTPIQQILPAGVKGSITQVDVWGDYAVVSGMEGGLAFAVVDMSDRTAPEPVSWYPSSADGWTARFSGDGNYVFYGCQRLEAFNPNALVRGSCEDPEALVPGAQPSGVIAVDVSDKANPRFVDFQPTGGSHNLVVETIDGVDYIFTNAVDILMFDVANQTLVPLATIPGQHDASVAKHPITGDWLMFTGTGELSIYNVNDPAEPVLVFEGDDSGGWTGWHEQTLVPGVVDGRAILVLAGEAFLSPGDPQDEEGTSLPDVLSIVDVSDPTAPVLLSQWQPPFDPRGPWVSYLFSIHEVAANPTGQVAIGWYHAGVWVLDVSTQDRQSQPVILAAYLPHEDISVTPSTFAQTPLPYVPFVWGAGWAADGHLIVPDMHTGLYILEPSWGLIPGVDSGQ